MTGKLKASWSRRGREKAEDVVEKEAPGFLEAPIPPSFSTYLWTNLPCSSSYLAYQRSLG